MNLIEISGRDIAVFSATPATARASEESFFRNFLLAGIFEKRFSTITVVPFLRAASEISVTLPYSALSMCPKRSSFFFDIIRILDTDEIAASASPLKPSVTIPSRSAAECILLVAWRMILTGRSSPDIPQPLSVTRINDTPPRFISTVISSAPESIAFSRSSFTQEEGRSTTSPAAIIFATRMSSTFIIPIQSISFPAFRTLGPPGFSRFRSSRLSALSVLPAFRAFDLSGFSSLKHLRHSGKRRFHEKKAPYNIPSAALLF